MSTLRKSLTSVVFPVVAGGIGIAVVASCTLDAGPGLRRSTQAWLPGARNLASAEAPPAARIHSAGLKNFIGRHKALRRQFKGEIPRGNVCGALLASAQSQLPAIEQAVGAPLPLEARRVMFAALIARLPACSDRISTTSRVSADGVQRMTVFTTPLGPVESLICEEEPEDECLSDDDAPWQSIIDGATAAAESSAPATARTFSDLVSGVSTTYAGSLNPADVAVMGDVGGVASSSEAEWAMIAEEIVEEGTANTMSLFGMPPLSPRAAQVEGFDPCLHLYDDQYLDACRMRIFKKGVAADVIGGSFGVLGAKLAKRSAGKLLAKATARAITISASIVISGAAYGEMFEKYVLDL